jgi:ribonuclease BN (tRNA processing enzyme)
MRKILRPSPNRFLVNLKYPTWRITDRFSIKKTPHKTGINSSLRMEIAKKAGKQVKSLYLAHLSQRYDGNEKLILKEAKTKFKNTIIAEDLMQVKI